jgi:hypothetical protein
MGTVFLQGLNLAEFTNPITTGLPGVHAVMDYLMVNNGLSNFNLKDLCRSDDLVFAATNGGGVFCSADEGDLMVTIKQWPAVDVDHC